MPATDSRKFSLRDCSAVVGGISWGLALSHFFASGDMTGPWLVILFGPPLMILISPAHPILGWQVPIVAAVAGGAVLSRSAEDTVGMVFANAAMLWLMCTVLSSPWAIIFRYRANRFRTQDKIEEGASPSIGVGFLVFLACGMTLVGLAGTLYPQNAGDSNQHFPLDGFLLATAGAGLSIISYRLARNMGIDIAVARVLELVLGLSSILVILTLIVLSSARFFALLTPDAMRLGRWTILSGLEASAALLWLEWAKRQGHTASTAHR